VILGLVAGLYFLKFRPREIKVYITEGTNDGVVYILRGTDPPAGYIWGGGEGMFIGTGKGGDHSTVSRGLMRFNISGWNGQNVTLRVYCTYKNGTPGDIEIYVIDDFGALPEEARGDPNNPDDPGDVSSYWNLYKDGDKVASVKVNVGEWLEVIIPKDIIEKHKTSEGIIAFMFKIADETIPDYNFYGLETYEYASKNNLDPPYLMWTE